MRSVKTHEKESQRLSTYIRSFRCKHVPTPMMASRSSAGSHMKPVTNAKKMSKAEQTSDTLELISYIIYYIPSESMYSKTPF